MWWLKELTVYAVQIFLQDQLEDEESSYVLATDKHMADNVDQWILGNTSAEASVQSGSNIRRYGKASNL